MATYQYKILTPIEMSNVDSLNIAGSEGYYPALTNPVLANDGAGAINYYLFIKEIA